MVKVVIASFWGKDVIVITNSVFVVHLQLSAVHNAREGLFWLIIMIQLFGMCMCVHTQTCMHTHTHMHHIVAWNHHILFSCVCVFDPLMILMN